MHGQPTPGPRVKNPRTLKGCQKSLRHTMRTILTRIFKRRPRDIIIARASKKHLPQLRPSAASAKHFCPLITRMTRIFRIVTSDMCQNPSAASTSLNSEN
jgi:hypothetical protein